MHCTARCPNTICVRGERKIVTPWLAEDTNLRRRVALKFLRAEAAGSLEAAARLLREARAASALDHSHIATIYEIGDHAGQPFIAMAQVVRLPDAARGFGAWRESATAPPLGSVTQLALFKSGSSLREVVNVRD